MTSISRLAAAILLGLLASAPAHSSDPPDLRDPARHVALAERDAAQDEMQSARDELRVTQRELERLSTRVAELARNLSEDEIRRALSRAAFTRPMLGLVIAAHDRRGVLLAAITPDSPAADAGLRSGDVLVRIDGTEIDGDEPQARAERARTLLGRLEEGQRVKLRYEREGRSADVEVRARNMPALATLTAASAAESAALAARLSSPIPLTGFEIGPMRFFTPCAKDDDGCDASLLADAMRWRGLRLVALNAELGRYFGSDRGVLVLRAVPPELQAGDVLLEIDGIKTDEPGDVMQQLRSREPGELADALVLRERQRRHLRLKAPATPAIPLLWTPEAPPAPPAPPVPVAPPPPNAPTSPARPVGFAPAPSPAAAPEPAQQAAARPEQTGGVLHRVLN